MDQSKISNHLLFTQTHFDLLNKLYTSSFKDFLTPDEIYKVITEATAHGLQLDRASYWKIADDRLICMTMFNKNDNSHCSDKDLFATELPNYFNALKSGIAIVADNALTNEFTKELKEKYLIPNRITEILDLPIRENGILVGVLCCEHRDVNRKWSDSDFAFARTVGDMLTLLIEQCRHRNTEREIKKLYAVSKKLNEKLLDFTYIISHNVRSNTSNMSMIIDLISESQSIEEKREYFALLKESSDKLSETIHYLNETINIQVGSKEGKTKLNVRSEIEKTLLGVNGIIKKEKASIAIEVANDLEIQTIPSYFESIMFNLITNAIKYKSPQRQPEIIIAAKKINAKIVITVKDNGLGIDLQKNKNKIFGMYKTFHGNDDAVGLGLFMTKNHVEALGGKISVDSEVGVGSVFKVIL